LNADIQKILNQIQEILNAVLNVLQVMATFLIAFLVILWLTLCFWTFRDIQSRSRDIIAQIFATLLVVFFNIPGVLLYILVRPKETLAQAYERSLQEEYMLQDLEEREICPTCRVKTQPDFVFCFSCRTRLRRECTGCNQLIKVKWASCPYCGTPQKVRSRESSLDRAGLRSGQTNRPGGSPVPTGGRAIVPTGVNNSMVNAVVNGNGVPTPAASSYNSGQPTQSLRNRTTNRMAQTQSADAGENPLIGDDDSFYEPTNGAIDDPASQDYYDPGSDPRPGRNRH
jgi:hypothetical protein